eukprot:scaffold3597_cov82-Skeletonema_marinoi.AAC.1
MRRRISSSAQAINQCRFEEGALYVGISMIATQVKILHPAQNTGSRINACPSKHQHQHHHHPLLSP